MSPMIDIIDDDDAVRDSTLSLLEAYGYRVREHASAERFLLSAVDDAQFLVVDQHMPGMTGIVLLEYLRARGNNTPAIMITGQSDSNIEPRASAIGVKMLQKPLNYDELLGWIDSGCNAGIPVGGRHSGS